MSIFNKKPKEVNYEDPYDRGFYNPGGEDDGVVGEDDDLDMMPAAPAPTKKPAPTAGGSGALKVVKPHDAEDGLQIADFLMQGFTVVMNIEALERDITIRLIDFLQGALHVLDGELRRVTKSTFVLSPRKGEVEEGEFARRGDGEDY